MPELRLGYVYMSLSNDQISEVDFQLRKIINQYANLFVYHQWPSERERWIELIFALTTSISDKSEFKVRDIIKKLDNLGLLSATELSQIPKTNDGIDFDFPHVKRIVEFLSESGFTEKESKSSALVMYEAAKSLKEHYDGKIQKYLRSYGERMLEELYQNFSFSSINEDDVKYAFTYWLQNVLNMPLSLKTKNMEKFCKKLQITDKELLKSADDAGVNFAWLDDVIDKYISDHHSLFLKKESMK